VYLINPDPPSMPWPSCSCLGPQRALARDPEKTRGVLVDGNGAPRFLREVRPFRIYDGPSETHRWAIARRVLRAMERVG
jgi:alkylation response protein AidB-like acyl-CoA dehydrogenase